MDKEIGMYKDRLKIDREIDLDIIKTDLHINTYNTMQYNTIQYNTIFICNIYSV